MRNILLLAANTLKVTFRKKVNFIVYLILPIASILLIMGAFSADGSSTVNVGIVNKDNTTLSQNMIKYLENTGKFKGISLKEEDIKEDVVNKKVDLALIIPEGFEDKIYNNNFDNIKIISLKGAEVTAWVEEYTNMYVKNLLDISKAANGDRKVFNEIYSNFENSEVSMKVEKVEDMSLSKQITQSGFGIFIMFIMISVTITSNLIIKEKQDRVYQRICSTPVSSKVYVIGNIISNLIIVTIQIILALLAVNYILKIDTYIPGYQLFFILIVLGIAVVGIGMIVVAFSKSSAEAGNLSTLIVTPTCMLGGCFWPISLMPEGMQKIANFIPQKWAIDAIAKLQRGETIGLNILVLICFALVFFSIAAFKMKHTDKTGSFV